MVFNEIGLSSLILEIKTKLFTFAMQSNHQRKTLKNIRQNQYGI